MIESRERATTTKHLAPLFVESADTRDATGLAEVYAPDAVLGYPPGSSTVDLAERTAAR